MSKRLENLSMGAVLLLIVGFVLCAPVMLAGCASIGLPTPETPAQKVYAVKASLVSAEDLALAYAQSKCPVDASPCTAPGVMDIAQAIIAADRSVNVAEAAVKVNGNDADAVNSAVAAVEALQALVTHYAKPATAPPPATTSSASTGAAS